MNAPRTQTTQEPATLTTSPSPVEMAALSLVLNALAWAAHTALIGSASSLGFALLTGAVAFVTVISLALSLRARADLRHGPVDRGVRALVGLSLAIALGSLIVTVILLLNVALFLWRTA
jgi:hypothetical protein